METTAQPNQNPAPQPDGIEVKLNLSKTAVYEILLYFLAMFASSALYIYIWEEFSSFNWGHFIGLHYGKSVLQLLLAIVGLYILLYSLLGYFINGRSLKGLRWACDWKSIGLAPPRPGPMKPLPQLFVLPRIRNGRGPLIDGVWTRDRPVPLKHYRLLLLLPGILMGLLPVLHGFCTGNATAYVFGIISLLCCSSDFMMWYKLRPFDDEDLFRPGKNTFQGTVIRRNYAK